MTEDVRRKIEQEKDSMNFEIKRIEDNQRPRPNDPSFGKTIITALKILGVVVAIAAVNFLFLLMAIDSDFEFLFEFIIAVVIVFGIILVLVYIWGDYSSQVESCRRWEKENSRWYKQAEIDRIKRKYEARISNLERYGQIKKPSVYYPDEICLHCGSTNVEISPLRYPVYSALSKLEHRTVTCKDCGFTEFYS